MPTSGAIDELQIETERRSDDSPDFSPGRSARWLLPVSALVPAALVLGFLVPGLVHGVPAMPLVAISSLIVLLGMGVLYFYAYSLYSDRFYSLLAVGWLANAIYVCCEALAVGQHPNRLLTFAIFFLAQLYAIPFYFAAFVPQTGQIQYGRISIELGAWWMALAVAVGMHSAHNPQPPAVNQIGIGALLIAVAYSIRSLTLVASSFRLRLRLEVHGRWAKLIPISFYAYACLQPLYLINLEGKWRIAAFVVALAIKFFNGVGVFFMTLLDLGTLKQRLEFMEMWQDLAILTFAVEHDIKNPLQVIGDNLLMLEQKHQANADVTSRVQNIRGEMRRIYSTTEIIQTLRGGRRYYDKLMQRTNVVTVVDRSIRAVKSEMSASEIHFVQNCQQAYIRAYPPQLQQVFVNILRNAVEAIREEKPTSGVIRVTCGPVAEGKIAIRFTDNGCGMEASVIGKLGKFYTTKRDRKPNSGIGLYVSRRILGFHDAHFEWQSKPHNGTTVSVVFPLSIQITAES